jgi:L-seryl-tRNA(Ser) seleniumtransferase
MPARKPSAPSGGALLRRLPQVEKLLQSEGASALIERYSRPEVLRALRGVLDGLRAEILAIGRGDGNGKAAAGAIEAVERRLGAPSLLDAARAELEGRRRPYHRRVINGTGVILHTGLGRAVLAADAAAALSEALGGYTLVEIDAASGERNRREGFVAALLSELTGAESATVVNNNAGATLIILAALARGREVVISRGQLVEIGGSFRIPKVMEESGARLVEVGATNRTYIEDYREAIGPETGLLLQVHTSNYEIAGFARHTPLAELVALGREHGLPVVSDLGSGCFLDLSPFGFRREPLVRDSVEAGADLVCFSGDKLLGGPQAGIIIGKRPWVERIRAHSLFRALRVDKLTLIALEATLRLYRDPERLVAALPTLRMIALDAGELRRRVERFRRSLIRRLGGERPGLELECVPSSAQAGSGSLPAQELPSWALALRFDGIGAERLAAALRTGEPPVFCRIQDERALFDFRTILIEDEEPLAGALARIATEAR